MKLLAQEGTTPALLACTLPSTLLRHGEFAALMVH
jgi:hypothetical protein